MKLMLTQHLIAAACLLGATASAQMPADLVKAERTKILEGVGSVPKTGAPGPIAIWGTMAFPILSAPDRQGAELAVRQQRVMARDESSSLVTTVTSPAVKVGNTRGSWRTA